ncbi:PAP2 superfamily protein [Motilibacter rhizosphaerae]|uniref:PAP2 superfamily protein n=1 Tax=Motilibacter rhizosphaerae TaxID=598652 RepID=A0A4Q7NBC3_9ACTN|nr:phosphatase PAP2 family protein [Motilibacter rhizosphaerae]RZS80199.1 PAP2 superfamily protein [Motilibacter rhizosphaerae]
MFHLSFGWRTAAELCAAWALLGLALALLPWRWARIGALAARECAVMVGLYGVWMLVGAYTLHDERGAVRRGQDIWSAERALHLPSEAWVQRPVSGTPLLAHAADAYYIYGHFTVLTICLAWTWWYHRSAYARLRRLIIVATLLATAVQVVPVAPPRLLPGHLVVDLGTEYGETVYGPGGLGAASQLAAMPSIHVLWSTLVGLTVVVLWRSRWRWLGLVHPVTMSLVVVVTGNHYWADGAVSEVLLAVSALAVLGVPRLLRGRSAPPSVVEPVAPATVPASAG